MWTVSAHKEFPLRTRLYSYLLTHFSGNGVNKSWTDDLLSHWHHFSWLQNKSPRLRWLGCLLICSVIPDWHLTGALEARSLIQMSQNGNIHTTQAWLHRSLLMLLQFIWMSCIPCWNKFTRYQRRNMIISLWCSDNSVRDANSAKRLALSPPVLY